jgi:hypothetical protein
MFDPIRMCEVLNDEGVDYVIVGGFASVAHGSSHEPFLCRSTARS